MMVFGSGIETLSFTSPQPLSFTQQYVLIEGLCFILSLPPNGHVI